MAVAWAMAECYLHFPDEIMPILRQNTLDPQVQQKTLQKIIESRTITSETRAQIRDMDKAEVHFRLRMNRILRQYRDHDSL